jgi:hypothetical protein
MLPPIVDGTTSTDYSSPIEIGDIYEVYSTTY